MPLQKYEDRILGEDFGPGEILVFDVVCARYAHQYKVAEERFDTSAEQYAATAFALGLVLARVGLLATGRGHSEVENDDLADDLEDDDFLFGRGKAPPAAKGALERLEDGTLAELGTI